MKLVSKKSKVCIIGADQNLDLLKSGQHDKTEVFVDTLINSNFEPKIAKPTRVTHDTATLIDNIFIQKSRQFEVNSYVITDDISDHFPCLACVTSKFYNAENTDVYIETRKLNDEAFAKMNQDLLFTNWSHLYDLEINQCYESLLSTILQVINKHAPTKRLKVTQKSCFIEPWINVSMLKMTSKCKKLFRKSIGLSPDNPSVVKYKDYRKALVAIKRHDKRKYYSELFKKISKNSRTVWSVMNSLIGKSRNKHSITTICDGGDMISDKLTVASKFNSHFTGAGLRVKGNIAPTTTKHTDYVKYKVKEMMLFKPTSETEISKIVTSMLPKKSSGYDGISNFVLKELISTIRLPLCILYNKSLQLGIFPDKMKLAKIQPLFKSGNMLLMDNFRPISLLPVLSKMLEKVVYKRLVSHMELNNILFPKQFGFRKNHSCIDAVETFLGNVLEGLEDDLNCLCIFIDLRKAFDTVSHEIILNFNGFALIWLKDSNSLA